MSKTKVNTNGSPIKKPKKAISLERKKSRAGWLFILPFLIGLILIYIPMIVNSVNISFSDYRGFELHPVGWENYQVALMEDPDFVQVLRDGLLSMLLNIPAIVFLSLFLAILLNQKMVGRAAFRAILFVPVILSTGLIDSLDAANSTMLNYMGSNEGVDTGAVGESAANEIISAADISVLFSNMKVGTGLVTYITRLVNNIYNIVNDAGVQILIFLAGLQSISPAIYESCDIDGATAWETFWKVTFPMISPMILVNTVYTVIDSFTKADNSVMAFIVNYESRSRTVATAMAWVYFLIVALIVVVVAALIKTFVFYQRRD
ncbi:MAG: sugar ABC transporter permease [Ruminococcaceae bacterium]|nr:sugar ABC transporter permease [Oscillospiraceae bacterium]